MKAVLCEAFGPAENLALAEVASPELKPGHVIVDIQSCALNFPDVLMVEGKYQSLPPFPFTPGGEFAGTVSQVAPDVSQWQVGDGVFAACGHGAMAEQITRELATTVAPLWLPASAIRNQSTSGCRYTCLALLASAASAVWGRAAGTRCLRLWRAPCVATRCQGSGCRYTWFALMASSACGDPR